jgi:hypothetical protein
MNTPAEYLLATNLHIADRAARKQGWHAHGREAWIKPDGNEVVFICFLEQVAAIDRLATIYYVGELPLTSDASSANGRNFAPDAQRFSRRASQVWPLVFCSRRNKAERPKLAP